MRGALAKDDDMMHIFTESFGEEFKCLKSLLPAACSNSEYSMGLSLIPRCAEWDWNIYLHECYKFEAFM